MCVSILSRPLPFIYLLCFHVCGMEVHREVVVNTTPKLDNRFSTMSQSHTQMLHINAMQLLRNTVNTTKKVPSGHFSSRKTLSSFKFIEIKLIESYEEWLISDWLINSTCKVT